MNDWTRRRWIASAAGIGGRWWAWAAALAPPPSSSPKSKIEPWPIWASSWAFWPADCAAGNTSSMPLRLAPVESRAPHLIRHSIARLFTARESTRSQKSQIEVISASARTRRIASTAEWPTFFTASRPKRIAFSLTTKLWSEVLTSGGSTSIPISAQRLTKNGTLSLVLITEEITAAMYSAG